MKNKRGQILVFVIIFIPVLLIVLAFTLATGKMVYYRIKLQNATDGAAYTAALWQARGLNGISDLNWALNAALVADISTLDVEFPVVRAIQKAQDAMNTSFAGASAVAMYSNFSSNIDKSKCVPFLLGIKDGKMFSLKVKRTFLLKKIPVYMVKDQPEYWMDQNSTGPLIRVMGIRSPDSPVFGAGLLGSNIPMMESIAQAMPARLGDEYKGTEYLGGLWDPTFYAKLKPVSARVPILKMFVLH